MPKNKKKERVWVEVSKKPSDFRLVTLLEKEKTYRGWWTGYQWDGARIPKTFFPTHWRPVD